MVCVIIYAINYGLGVVGLEMAMDSRFYKVEPMLGEKAAHGQPTARLGTVKNSSGLLVEPKMVHVCCKQNFA